LFSIEFLLKIAAMVCDGAVATGGVFRFTNNRSEFHDGFVIVGTFPRGNVSVGNFFNACRCSAFIVEDLLDPIEAAKYADHVTIDGGNALVLGD
jgi:hypothetical protein